MAAFDEIQFRVCEICAYLVAYGEYDDGEDTAEEKWKAWGTSGYEHMIRYMSVSNTDGSFTHAPCELCGEIGYNECELVALVPK